MQPVLFFLIAFFSTFAENLQNSNELKHLTIDTETKAYLFEKAEALTGITQFELSHLPVIYRVSKKEMANIVCPEAPHECDRLAAVFDDIQYRILILDSFEISENFKPFDYSFLIHEIIHSLQYLERGSEIFKDCQAIYNTEEEAYSAQDKYLKSEGEFFRAGIALKFFYCDEEQAHQDYLESLEVWEKRKQEGWTPGKEN